MRRLVLEIPWGGLGDHLFWSHIPRIASAGGSEVWMSDRCEFRSPDYRQLWLANPHVRGFTPERGDYRPSFGAVAPGMNLLDRIMLDLGFDDGLRWHEPEFHPVVPVLPLFEGRTIFDPNYISNVGEIDVGKLRGLVGAVDWELPVRHRHFALGGLPHAATGNLAFYAGMIRSCRRFHCLNSGGAVLAAALGVPATCYFGRGQGAMFQHSHLHQYVNAS